MEKWNVLGSKEDEWCTREEWLCLSECVWEQEWVKAWMSDLKRKEKENRRGKKKEVKKYDNWCDIIRTVK